MKKPSHPPLDKYDKVYVVTKRLILILRRFFFAFFSRFICSINNNCWIVGGKSICTWLLASACGKCKKWSRRHFEWGWLARVNNCWSATERPLRCSSDLGFVSQRQWRHPWINHFNDIYSNVLAALQSVLKKEFNTVAVDNRMSTTPEMLMRYLCVCVRVGTEGRRRVCVSRSEGEGGSTATL